MVKKTKKIIKFRDRAVMESLGETLYEADESDLRILLALMLDADEEGGINEEFSFCESLGVAREDVTAAIKFWQGAGIIRRNGKSARSPETAKTTQIPKTPEDIGAEDAALALGDGEKEVKKTPTKHRDGVITKSRGLSGYGIEELADMFEKRRISAEFVDYAQKILGKTFNPYDTQIIVALIDQLRFSEEAVSAILAYAAKQEKTSLRYCEKIAIYLYDNGIVETKAVIERLERMESYSGKEGQIRRIFGIGSRALSKNEEKIVFKWINTFGYDIDVITIAYDITVDRTQRALIKYADAIISGWYNEGLKNAEQIKEFEARKCEEKGGSKSYDVNDFFNAALERSFEDLK